MFSRLAVIGGNMKSKKLNANHLKMIAIVAMTIDHIADIIYPSFPANPVAIVMHMIGRLTAPIMWFFIAEGFFYTKNYPKYLFRMFVFALVSHFTYCFAFGINYIPFSRGDIFNQTSVMWPLAWGLVALFVLNKTEIEHWLKIIIILVINVITFPSDWSCIAVMAIVAIYSNRGNLKKQMSDMMIWVAIYAIISFFFVDKLYGVVQLSVALVYPVLKLYNGEKGKASWMKWFFYIYYPAHLIIIGILRLTLYGDVPLLFN